MYFTISSNLKKRKKIFYFIILLVFSISFNQYYGYIGIHPLDSFIIFNSGYDTMNGYFPFKDYYTTTGPLLNVVQALFFKIFGVSWFSFVLHASVINFIITIATFYTLIKFKLNINYCFFYALLVSILAYPTAGTPHMDFHSTFLSIVALFSFILALKTKSNFYWFVLPICLGLAFLSKQVPAGYIFVIVFILSIIYFSFNFNIKSFFSGILGGLIFIILFVLIMKIGKISLISFFEQYILFPQALGKTRLEFLFPLEFGRIILRFKLMHLSLLLLLVVCTKKIIEDYRYLKNEEFLIIISLISASFALIIYELMTVNDKFIFFVIPIFVGFSHIYYEKYFKQKKYILYLLILLSISSTLYYQYNYIDARAFLSLDRIKIKNAIDAKILDKKLNKLKWVTPYSDKPKKEISQLKEAIKIIKNDSRNKTIVTDYQFISVVLSIYDYSPNFAWHEGVTYPSLFHSADINYQKNFEIYRNFFIGKLNENKIEVVYTIKPLYGLAADDVFKSILDKNCVKKTVLTNILNRYLIHKCSDLKY